MVRLKGCPRCRGDMFRDRDYFGAYWQCLQCGCQIQDDAALRRPVRQAA